jgi:pyroglutamyl-peptidase
MGSEGPSSPVTTVHVTGFKKFHGVAENPTEKIVRNLPSFMETKGLPKGLVLGSCTVLEAAGQGALGPLYELLESTVSGRECGMPSQERVILVVSFSPSHISVQKVNCLWKYKIQLVWRSGFINFMRKTS